MKLSVHQSHSLFYLWAFSFCQVSRLQCWEGVSESHLYSSTRCPPPLQACFDLTKLRVLPGLKHYDLRYVAKLQQQLISACRTSVLYISSCTSNQGLHFCSFFSLCVILNSTEMHLYFNCGWSACLHPLYQEESARKVSGLLKTKLKHPDCSVL